MLTLVKWKKPGGRPSHILWALLYPGSSIKMERGDFFLWFLLCNWPCWASPILPSDLSCSCDSVSASWGLSKQASFSSFFRPDECTLKLWSTSLVRMHSAAGWCVHLSAGYWGGLLCSTLYVHRCFPAFPDPTLTTQCDDIKDRLAK